MKFSKGMFAILGLAVAGVAAAQEGAVTATKTSPVTDLYENMYGSFEMRHYTQRAQIEDEVVNDRPYIELRPGIGTKLFNKKVDTSFNWIFTKHAENDSLKKSYFYNMTLWKVLDGERGFIGPYAETYFNENTFTESYVGAYGELAAPELSVPGGALSISSFWQPMARITSTSTKDNVTVKNETGRDSFSLADASDEPTKIEQKDSTLINYVGVGIKYKPSAVKGFSVGVSPASDSLYSPKYAAVAAGDSETAVSERDGYAVDHLTINKFTLSYGLTENVTITNQLRHYMNGVYGGRMDVGDANPLNSLDKRWENRLMLSASLF